MANRHPGESRDRVSPRVECRLANFVVDLGEAMTSFAVEKLLRPSPE